MRARIAGRLALDLVARTAGADTRITGRKISRIRVAALNDEVGHDAVELHAVIEAAVGELLEVLDGFRRVLFVQVRDHGAAIGFERGAFHD